MLVFAFSFINVNYRCIELTVSTSGRDLRLRYVSIVYIDAGYEESS